MKNVQNICLKEEFEEESNANLEKACRLILQEIQEDPKREGLVRTPLRYAKAVRELTVGYEQNGDSIVNGALFPAQSAEMVVVKDIEFYSLCEHHLLPFFGKVSVAYLPDEKIVGLSKIPRIVNMYARRLQVQERLTQQICNELIRVLEPRGVACIVEGLHMCMMMRGIQVQSSKMITTALKGEFEENLSLRHEFFGMVKG